jgi:large subunit ribosomal protein L6
VPSGVEVSISDKNVNISGSLGRFDFSVGEEIKAELDQNLLKLSLMKDTPRGRTLWGTARSILSNMVVGVHKGFTEVLDINGVGYRAAVEGNTLVLQLGYSHEVRYDIPQGITIKCPKPTQITVFGASKQQVGQVSSEIRSFRAPEPYKGKGIKYETEILLRKEGKKK